MPRWFVLVSDAPLKKMSNSTPTLGVMPEYPRPLPAPPTLELIGCTTNTKPSAPCSPLLSLMPPGLVMRNEKKLLKSAAFTVVLLNRLPDLAAAAGTRRSTVPSLVLTAAAAPLSARPVVVEKSGNDTVTPDADRAVRARRTSAAARGPGLADIVRTPHTPASHGARVGPPKRSRT